MAAITTDDLGTASSVTDHTTDATDAHDASAISNVAAGNIAATDLQAAINELDSEKAAVSHVHAAGDTTSGTFAEARIPYTLTSANGAVWTDGQVSEEITLSTGGATTDSAADLLPANSEILAVVARVTTTITTATDWSLGDATTAARFAAANSTLTAGTTSVGLDHRHGGVATDATGPVQTAAAKLRITTTGTPGAGAIRVTVFYRQFTPPQS